MTHSGYPSRWQLLLVGLVIALIAVPAYALPGDLDTTFGNNGIYLYPTGTSGSVVRSSLIQPDGRIVLIGFSSDTSGEDPTLHFPTVERLLSNGAPDPSFGNGGAIRFSFSGEFDSVALQPDGKLLIAGQTNETGPAQYLLVRCNPDGSLDTTFGGTGKITAQFTADSTASWGNEVLLRPNGRIIVVGTSSIGSGLAKRFAVAQYTNGGALDPDFGTAGATVVLNTDWVEAAALQPDGKLIISAYNDVFLARLNPNGTVDTTFGNNGILNQHFSILYMEIKAVKVLSDGKILVAGFSRFKFAYVVLVRVTANGAIDPTFFPSGTTVQSPDTGNGYDLDVQPDGKIVVVAWVSTATGTEFGVFRYRPDGKPDPGFGSAGRVNTNLEPAISAAGMTVRLQTDGKIVVAGGVFGGTPAHIAVRLKGGEQAATVRFDYDGDGKTDISTFRPSNTNWNLLRSGSGSTAIQWGLATDTLAPADFDGDGKTNVAVYRDGVWKIIWSDGTYRHVPFGQAGDLPRPGDFDGDGLADIAVWRPSTGYWFWLNSSNGQYHAAQFGTNADIPLIADFDRDGKSDIAVFRPSQGNWYYLRSTDGQYVALHFGTVGDIPVPADFDGDKRTDLAVFRPSNGIWYRLNSSNGQYVAAQFGTDGDVPVAGDYDGDNKSDLAVFRPSNNVWYLLNSSTGYTGIQYGAAGDRPVPSAYSY